MSNETVSTGPPTISDNALVLHGHQSEQPFPVLGPSGTMIGVAALGEHRDPFTPSLDKKKQEAQRLKLYHEDIWPKDILKFVGDTDRTKLQQVDHRLMELVNQASPYLRLRNKQEIWGNIFDFLGRGHHIYVALVCKRWRAMYLEFVTRANRPGRVFCDTRLNLSMRRPTNFDTYYSAVFCNLSCAKFCCKHLPIYLQKSFHLWKVPTLAAYYGNLEVFKWVYQLGYRGNEDTTAMAAALGKLDILKYAHEEGCRWNTRTTECARLNRHFDVLKYAYKEDCPWYEDTFKWAAKNGHLDVDEDTFKWAAKNGHLF